MAIATIEPASNGKAESAQSNELVSNAITQDSFSARFRRETGIALTHWAASRSGRLEIAGWAKI